MREDRPIPPIWEDDLPVIKELLTEGEWEALANRLSAGQVGRGIDGGRFRRISEAAC
jgi:hypothetical protein